MTAIWLWVKSFQKKFLSPAQWPTLCQVSGAVLLLVLVLASISSSLVLWPRGDEADYLLQARSIAEGQLPYRDFFVFMTPLGQWLSAGLVRLMGVNVLGIRLVLLGLWALEWLMLFRLARRVMPMRWVLLMLAFLWAVDTRYLVDQHHFWSGFFALAAVYQVSQWLFEGRTASKRLVFSGLLASAAFWSTQSLGVFLAVALLGFSFWDSHMAESDLASRARAWWHHWGRFAVMPAVGMSLVIVAVFYGLGIFDDFWRDTMGWLSGGHYAQTTIISPWSTFHDEWEKTLLPLFLSNIQYPIKAIFIPRLFIALLLAAIFILPMPVLGWALAKTFGALGKIFVVNVQDNESENKAALVVSDSVWVLWAFSAIAMTVSTFTYATSMHIASNSGLVYLLAFSGLAFCARACQKKVKFIEPLLQTALSCCYILVFIGVCIGCWMHFAYGYWLPAFRPMAGRTLFIDGQQKAVSMLETIDAANLAVAQGKKVMVFYQSPELYLAGDFHNPTRFTLILPYYTSDAQVSEMLKKLEQDPPACVIDDHSLYGLLGDPRFSRYAAQTFGMLRVPGIEAWLNRHYRIASRNPYFTLYQRGW